MQKIRARWHEVNSLLCVGLDPDTQRFPASIGSSPASIRSFNREIIQATADVACAFKPNLGFYLPYGSEGLQALLALRDDVPDNIPLILDAKVGDIPTTSEAYARAYFDEWGFDAVTAQPFLGHDSLAPFIDHPTGSVFILAKTSNPGSGFLQDAIVDGKTVSGRVADATLSWNTRQNLGLVAGATYPGKLREIRDQAGDLPILIPGVGAQAGDLAAAVRAGLDREGMGILVNSSRAISYASSGSDFADAARAVAESMRDEINDARTAAIPQTV